MGGALWHVLPLLPVSTGNMSTLVKQYHGVFKQINGLKKKINYFEFTGLVTIVSFKIAATVIVNLGT